MRRLMSVFLSEENKDSFGNDVKDWLFRLISKIYHFQGKTVNL